LTLTELVDIALSHNPDSKAAWWQANRAAALVGVAKSAYFPTLDFNTYASKGQEYEFTNGPNRKFTETGVNLTLNMLLFDFGERSCDVTMRKKALEAANWEADFSLQKVMIDTLESAYAVLHAQEVVIAARITRDDATKMLDISEQLQNAGLTPITDVYTSRATLSEMKMNLAKWQAELDIRKGKLAQHVGFSADKVFELAPLSALAAPHIEDTKTLLAKAKSHRADLLAKAAKLQESQASLEKSYTSYLPKVSLTATGGLQHYQHDHTKHGNYSVTANVDIPIFSGLDSIYKTRVAYAETKSSIEELAALELAVAYEVISATKQHEAAALMLEYADISLENNRLAYEAALEKYKAGKESMFQEVSNALQMLAQARVRYSEVKTDWLTSLARIAYATGTNSGV
ncbi:MAG: TolC family protein, partial [Chlamydiales bacterium]|nr:TolC family protein [Chlamydiales bacterium]